jgi:hypothetical protein
MPHPDRNLFSVQRPDWPLQKERAKRAGKKLPFDSDGLQIFKNGVGYFS